jgi:hypothetical protein
VLHTMVQATQVTYSSRVESNDNPDEDDNNLVECLGSINNQCDAREDEAEDDELYDTV